MFDAEWIEKIALIVKKYNSSAYIIAVVVVIAVNWFYQSQKPVESPAFPLFVAEKLAKEIEDDVEKKVKGSRRLGVFRGERSVAKLHIKELKIGDLVGDGSFCDVREVKEVSLSMDERNDNEKEEEKRFELVEKSKARLQNFKYPYVIKHVRSKIVEENDKEEFAKAASELIMEAKYLEGLSHKNIISIRAIAKGDASAYAKGGHSDSFFILMDRIETTLKNKLNQWRLAEDQGHGAAPFVAAFQPNIMPVRMQYVRDLASACDYLHQQNLVYRDFKPSNIGFDWKGTVKLLDFGLIAELPKEGYLTQRAGTVRYIAPETALGKYDSKADVFALVLILWEILALQSYFVGKDTNLDHIKAIVEGEREPLNETWPIGIRKLIIKCQNGDPRKRPNMKQMGAALEAEIEKLQDKADLTEAATNDSADESEGTFLKQ
mmetsp:Transcript_32605/g.49133  ORF Transcript_32605/g.49133 Transcript_32605/m.49133 type:complete len:434 (-) Transcript_32605:53-1354(-)